MGEAALKLQELWKAEARSAPRTIVYASVGLSTETNFWTGLSMNISEGGLFVATHRIVPIGTMLLLSMMLPFDPEWIVTVSEVRWTRGYSDQADVPPGLGLRFVDTRPHVLAKIKRFVSTVREPIFFEE